MKQLIWFIFTSVINSQYWEISRKNICFIFANKNHYIFAFRYLWMRQILTYCGWEVIQSRISWEI